jgi:hypothetical protein
MPRSRLHWPAHRHGDAERTARGDPGRGYRPDIRTPELVNPLLLDFLVGVSR